MEEVRKLFVQCMHNYSCIELFMVKLNSIQSEFLVLELKQQLQSELKRGKILKATLHQEIAHRDKKIAKLRQEVNNNYGWISVVIL